MRLPPLLNVRSLLGGLLLACVALLPIISAPSHAEDLSREQQINELEKQIQDLTKKLTDLRQKPATPTPAVPEGIPADWIKALTWRCIGPASMGGRIGSLAVFEADPTTYWIGTASGGLLKTTNNGVTFEHQFDHENTVSIGAVCVAPSDRNIVWVGTGENNPRNSASYGDGVYKSSDGGKTWKNMGLKQSFQIGKIVVHPKNPDVVYVGVLGRLYGPSKERGLYRTRDGGKTWKQVLFVDDKTGVIDVAMNPAEPDTLLVATWERTRDGFDSHRGEPPLEDGYDAYDPVKKWGPGSGIWKTVNGGESWSRVTKGLPTSHLGRIGLDYYRKNPSTVFAIIDCQKIGMGQAPAGAFLGIAAGEDTASPRLSQVTRNSPAARAGLRVGDVVQSVTNKEIKTYKELVDQIHAHKAGDKLELKVQRGQETLTITPTLEGRSNRPYSFGYGGQRENVQDRQGPNSFEYGGVYKSTDGGETWTRINSINSRPMYFSQVRVDPSDENHLFALGIAMYRSSDGGKTFKPDGGNRVHSDQHALWIDPRDGRHMLCGTDGGTYVTYDRMDHWDFLNHQAIGQFYHVAVDSRSPYRVYGGLQDNGSWGGPSQVPGFTGPINEDWVVVNGGDGFVCRVDAQDPDVVYFETQDGGLGRRNLRTGERAGLRPADQQGLKPFRFNWNTPFILSSHNPRIWYAGGNYVFRSLKQGGEARVISPEISRTGRGTCTVLAESPRNPEVLWAGTDDGNLWVTRDGGAKWVNVFEKVGLPGPRWIASIEPSRYVEGRTYVAFDAHRSDDDEPYLFVTEDYGQTWKPLRGNLPTGSTRVLREDIENQNLLYAGTEFAVWASIDRGKVWTKLNNNLPTVAIHELAQHPTAGELVAATHGRSLWILDVTPLRQMTADVVKAPTTLYRPNTATRWRPEPQRLMTSFEGSRRFVGENPPRGAQIYYSLGKKAEKVSLKIVDYNGATVRPLDAKATPGLHRAGWDLIRSSGGALGAAVGLLGPRRQQAEPAAPGMYRVVLTVDGKEYTQGLRVVADPNLPSSTLIAEEENEPPKRRTFDTRMDD